jgi:uncharacterized coiled-coil protein SlyX
LVNRVEQAENRVWRTEDRVEEINQIVKDQERMAKQIQMKYSWSLGHHEKTKPTNHGCRRKRGDAN